MGYGKHLGQLLEHFNGGLDIIVFPVGNTLFGDAQAFCQLHLAESPCLPEQPDPLIEHI